MEQAGYFVTQVCFSGIVSVFFPVYFSGVFGGQEKYFYAIIMRNIFYEATVKTKQGSDL